jgi:hypothetical protein
MLWLIVLPLAAVWAAEILDHHRKIAEVQP